MSRPFVSIVIPTYNRLCMLMETVEALCNQTYPETAYEIIVVDDGSSDGTEEWLYEIAHKSTNPAIRCFRQLPGGPAAARNLGIQEARGGFIAFTDDDCLPETVWLETLVTALDADTKCAIGGRIVPRDMAGLVSRYCTSTSFNGQADEGEVTLNALNTANALCPRQALLDIGGFDTAFRWPGGEDTDLAYRLRDMGFLIKACPSAVMVHMNKDTLRGLHSAFFNRGCGHSLIHAKRHPNDLPSYVVLCVLKALWNVMRLVVESPLVGTWNLIWRGMALADAYGFAAMDATTKVAKYCGHVKGRFEYKRDGVSNSRSSAPNESALSS